MSVLSALLDPLMKPGGEMPDKMCRDCTWARWDQVYDRYFCGHEKSQIVYGSGESIPAYCVPAREDGPCGRRGKFFERKSD